MAAMFYSFEEAVRRLKTTKDELKAMVEHGKLREFRDGLDRLFRVDEVEAVASQASDTIAEEAASPLTTEPTSSEDETVDIGAALEEEVTAGIEEGELEISESKGSELDAPSFDIRVELGMLDTEESDMHEHPIASEAAAAVTFTDDFAAEEQIEDEPPVASKPAAPTPRPVPMGYGRLSPPKRSAWQWFVGGLREDRPAAVVILFVLLGIVLSGCAALGYVLHKLL